VVTESQPWIDPYPSSSPPSGRHHPDSERFDAAEVERLDRELREMAGKLAAKGGRTVPLDDKTHYEESLEAEVERLRIYADYTKGYVERLRGALRQIQRAAPIEPHAWTGDDAVRFREIARAALADEDPNKPLQGDPTVEVPFGAPVPDSTLRAADERKAE
jgi:hypothetical protein